MFIPQIQRRSIRRRTPLVLAGLFLILLGGCTVGPNFKPPATTMPADWIPPTTAPSTQQVIPHTELADLRAWWEAFNDPQLNSLIDRAIEANLTLRQAALRVRQARASRRVVSAAWYPTVDGSGSYRRSGADNNSSGLFAIGLDANWEIDIFGGTRRSVEASDADIQLTIEDERDLLITVISEIAFNYIDLRGFQREIEIAQGNLTIQRHSADVTRRRNVAGLVGGLDTANAEASVATTESAIPSLEQSVRQTIHTLSVLLGLPPESLVDELSEPAPIPTLPQEVPVGLPSDLLRRRPDIRRAEADLHSATARVGVAVADLYPRFSLTGSLGSRADRVGQLFNWSNSFWSIGPTVSIPLFNAGRLRANVDVQKLGADQSLVTYDRTILLALQEVENALIAYEKEQERRVYLVTAVEANRRAVRYATELYTNGLTNFIDVLNAQRSLLATEDALVRSDRNIAANLVALYKALGGGWDTEE